MEYFRQLENHSGLEMGFENRLSDLRQAFCRPKQEDGAHSKMETVLSCESCRWHFICTIVEMPRSGKKLYMIVVPSHTITNYQKALVIFMSNF